MLPAITAPPSPAKQTVKVWLGPQTWLLMKMALFFVKIVTITNHCSPVAPNQFLFNSSLLLALLDFFNPSLISTIFLLLAHIIAATVAHHFNALCAGGGNDLLGGLFSI